MPVETISGDDVADLVTARDVSVQHRADVTMQFGGSAFCFRLDLCAEVETFLAVEFDKGFAEWLLKALVLHQSRGEIVAGVAETVGKAGGIERRLGGAGAGMRPRHEGGVAGQHDTAEYQLRRDQIIDRLKER